MNETGDVDPNVVEAKTPMFHLFQGIFFAPALVDHPIECSDQSRAISAERTVQKRRSRSGLASQHPQGADDILSLNVPSMHFEIEQAQSQALGEGVIRVGRSQVHCCPQPLAYDKRLEPVFRRLRTAIE